MKVLFTASEVNPFAKVGGLADVVGSLPKALKRERVDARIIMPKYGIIDQKLLDNAVFLGNTYVQMGWRNQYAGLFSTVYNGVTVYFVDNQYYFGGDKVYGYIEGEAEKFAFFCLAVLELLPLMDFTPEIIHCNDWQTGLIPVLLKTRYAHLGIKTVFTIHNLKFQGIYGIEMMKDLLSFDDSFFTQQTLEFYGGASYMKGGLLFADRITTVSRTYAKETQTEFFGERLDGVLRSRSDVYCGILNGLDYKEYNPATDKLIPFKYSADDISGKEKCRYALEEELGLPHSHSPIIAMVGRLYDQKGLALIERMLPELLLSDDFRLVVLGSGDHGYETMFQNAQGRYNDRVRAIIGFDNALAHRIYAGADLFLMPSLFEPCGLSQLIAMRYGTLPIVRETGGLADTVKPYNKYDGSGVGFSFENFNAHDMAYTIRYALSCMKDDEVRAGLIRNAMTADFSWTSSAKEYKQLYKQVLGKKR
ncbi:MAG: glycogen synthase GlgA [Clostridia bacterium]|nr:glycogen synthase GlgA [Clostridia bacterium]